VRRRWRWWWRRIRGDDESECADEKNDGRAIESWKSLMSANQVVLTLLTLDTPAVRSPAGT
jgi:hypothetical protein